MGGQSFRCPCCEKWFLYSRALRDHLIEKHAMPTHAVVAGTGPSIRITVEGKVWSP